MRDDHNTFFTQATNFTSAITGGVDPRTGLYSINITLGQLTGNRNLGPSLPLTLGYSALNITDTGFGIGFSPVLSFYDSDKRLLMLSTGEQYQVQESDTTVALLQQKLDTIRFEKDLINNCYRIIHKSGDIELLSGPNNAFTLKVPQTLLTPAGHALHLDWKFTDGQPCLTRIYDDTDGEATPLLIAEYDDIPGTKTTFNLWPGRQEGYRIELRFQNHLLSSVHNFSLKDNPLIWFFDYDPMGETGEWGNWLTGMTVPGGMQERVNYRNDGQGHRFPDSAQFPPLPFVTLFTQAPGGNQPVTQTRYIYSKTNFVGGYSNIVWRVDQDNLYGIMTDYTYGSTETRVCNGQSTRMERTYNSYHLLTQERASQNGCVSQTTTQYYAIVGQEFSSQPPQFQLPKIKTVTWIDAANLSRSENTETTFDIFGNPLTQMVKDGASGQQVVPATRWEYYPAQGDGDNCPPEPNGFTRFLKSMTQTPYNTLYDDVPVQRTTCRYSTINRKDAGTSVILKTTEQHFSGEQLLQSSTFSYNEDAHEFARLSSQTATLYADGATGAAYVSQQYYSFVVQGEVLHQTHSITSHDNLTLTRTETRSRFTGRQFSACDAQGNVTNLTYDLLGRPLSRTLNAGTKYENRQSYSYILTEDRDMPFSVTATDAIGNQLRNGFDGTGRPFRQDVKDTDGDGQWYTIQAMQYDELGRELSTTVIDHLRTDNHVATPLALAQTLAYDDWGATLSRTHSDGTIQMTKTDPVRLTTTSWVQAGDQQTGTEVTTFNAAGQPVKIALCNVQCAMCNVQCAGSAGQRAYIGTRWPGTVAGRNGCFEVCHPLRL